MEDKKIYLKCSDCLGIVCMDKNLVPVSYLGYDSGLVCGLCGGKYKVMGEVKGKQLINRESVCKCDERCVDAQGPICSCGCGGKNHGSGIMGYIEIEKSVGNIPKVNPKLNGKLESAIEYRMAVEKIDGIWPERWTNSGWLERSDWELKRNCQNIYQEIKNGKNHKNRMGKTVILIDILNKI